MTFNEFYRRVKEANIPGIELAPLLGHSLNWNASSIYYEPMQLLAVLLKNHRPAQLISVLAKHFTHEELIEGFSLMIGITDCMYRDLFRFVGIIGALDSGMPFPGEDKDAEER